MNEIRFSPIKVIIIRMPSPLKQEEMLVDHFEFLKTGFIMVIAFYFGAKSLEILRNNNSQSKKEVTEATA